MKKQFENIDDLSRFKINSLHDDDVDINDKLIWGKIEEELDKKAKIRVLAWRRIAVVACLILLIGGSIFMFNKEHPIAIVEKNTEKPVINIVSRNLKKDEAKSIQIPDSKSIKNKFVNLKLIPKKRLEINTELIKKTNLVIVERNIPTFKPIEVLPTLPQLPPKIITKMRVMHISEYKAEDSEVFIRPKTFYVQTDVQNIIKNQTPVIPYALANISN